MEKCAVVIPIYKTTLLNYEIASFQQCMRVLNAWDIYLVTYAELEISAYTAIAQNFGSVPIRRMNFPKEWFQGIQGYNRLCMGREFYEAFSEYEYMLIYQLDAWVFRDELSYWCSQGYDYIGAPWKNPECFHGKNVQVGNGGLCLRRIRAFIQPFKFSWLPIYSIKCLTKETNWKSYKSVGLCIAKMLGYHNSFKYWLAYAFRHEINEDLFWCIGLTWSPFFALKLPTVEEAMKFSIETTPSAFFQRNRNILPFGCHAFHKYEYNQFWKQYIKLDYNNEDN